MVGLRSRRAGFCWVLLALFAGAASAQGQDPVLEAIGPRSLGETSLAVDKRARYTPSPADWRDEGIYMAMVDRFARQGGPPRGHDPASGTSWHGGNLRSLAGKLDYIKGLGATTLWINPVVANEPGAYHGYAATNFLAVDPRFGTMTDLKDLVREAHRRDMKVVLDVVVNHAGRVFEYADGDGWKQDGGPKPIARWNGELHPTELQKPENFNRRGGIQNYDSTEQIEKGDFAGTLRDFATDRRDVQNLLIRTYLWWMKETDVDGFRLDTVKHTDRSLWPRFDRAVRTYAGKLGKQNFLLLGEVFDGNDDKVASYVGKGLGADRRTGRPLGLTGAFNYPAFFRENAALHGQAPTRQIEDSEKRTLEVFGQDGTGALARFVDNHDQPRFLGTRDGKSQLKVALAHTLLASGIPTLYYGTEQAFRQPEGKPMDPGNREDMFAGGYESKSSAGDNFRQRAPLYQYVHKLAGLRHDYPALRRGQEWVRWSDPQGPGIYAFSRIHDGQEVVVVLNTANEPRKASSMWVDAHLTPGGTELVDALHPRYRTAVRGAGGGSQVDVDVPPHGVRVLVHRQALVAAPAAAARPAGSAPREAAPRARVPEIRQAPRVGRLGRGR